MEKRFSGCEIAEMGIHIEENGRDFYNSLDGKSENWPVKRIFRYLADEETKHIDVFKQIFDSQCEREPRESYPEEYFSYMKALAGDYVFTRKNKGSEMAKGIKKCMDALNAGIGFEKESITFYEGMKRIVSGKSKTLVERLIGEEQKHLERLSDMKKEMEKAEA